jgi:hypothetical protein
MTSPNPFERSPPNRFNRWFWMGIGFVVLGIVGLNPPALVVGIIVAVTEYRWPQ